MTAPEASRPRSWAANRQMASVVVFLGRAVTQAGIVWLGVLLLLRACWIAFGWLLAAWRSRSLR